MMKSKRSSRTLVKPALIFSLTFSLFTLLSGCIGEIEPTYNEEEIPKEIQKICIEEYDLNVITKRTNNTLWIYSPLERILHEDFGTNQDKIFDEELIDKFRNILTTIGRVLISSDNTPEFYVIVASDINLGVDYTTIGYVLDIKKYYAGVIPWTEAQRRYVYKLERSPQAIEDTTGVHLATQDIQLSDFLAAQIAQRINSNFQNDEQPDKFNVKTSEGRFSDGVFLFEFDVKQIDQSDIITDINEEILNIVIYTLKNYDFKDFYVVELLNQANQNKISFDKDTIWARPIIIK